MNDAQAAPPCWIVTDGKIGMEVQCLALAEALGLAPQIKRIQVRAPWGWLPPSLWRDPLRAVDRRRGDSLDRPWPALVIASGRRSVAPALALRRASGGTCRAIQIQDPTVPAGRFDLVIVPEHDRLRGPNVIVTRGSLTRVTATRLASEAARHAPRLAGLPRPWSAVLLGGPNRSYRMPDAWATALADDLAAAVVKSGGSLLVTPSRRTPENVIARLRARLGTLPGEIWDGEGENPYYAYLGLADSLVVTGDSVNMVCEAGSTGRPVHVALPPGGTAKFTRFHDSLRAAGIARPFAGRFESWSYAPLNEASRAAAEVRLRLGLA